MTLCHWELWPVACKFFILTVLFLYPAQTTSIFSVLRCTWIVGIDDGPWLQMDLRVKCWSSEHIPYVCVAVAGLVVYVVGTPLYLYFQLYYHRVDVNVRHLSIRSKIFKFQLSSLYHQYLDHYWVRRRESLGCF